MLFMNNTLREFFYYMWFYKFQSWHFNIIMRMYLAPEKIVFWDVVFLYSYHQYYSGIIT